MLDIVDLLNSEELSNDTKLVSLDIINIFPSIDNEKGINAVMFRIYLIIVICKNHQQIHKYRARTKYYTISYSFWCDTSENSRNSD